MGYTSIGLRPVGNVGSPGNRFQNIQKYLQADLYLL
jgi:hypothetical protein